MEQSLKGEIFPEKLPPSKRASFFHGSRVYYQVMLWSNTHDNTHFQATDWGWQQRNGKLVPITTDLDIAPEALNNDLRCNCKAETSNPCGTRMCTCRRNGLVCFSFCSGCRGENFNNSM